jgi:hypothetical protein
MSAPDADEIDLHPNGADPASIVERKVPEEIRRKYEVYSYRNAAVILAETRQTEFAEICDALRDFSISTATIRKSGGNESDIPKLFNELLGPKGWRETTIRGDLEVTLAWREPIGLDSKGKPVTEPRSSVIRRERYLDGHKIDYVKDKVAFDLEWNSKDQTFDRDLYAFNAFFLSGAIDVAVLVTRSASLNVIFRHLDLMPKYGASTTWMGKLLYRLNAGRNGGCPVLVIGITPTCVSDWSPSE